jgi:hypothetical protein
MLQFRSTYGCAVTIRAANFQAISGTGRSKEGVVEQKKRKEKTDPLVRA